ncbi:MAG: aspartate ammonia-lyase [Candidatus Sifarchaeia archaeon]
MDTRIEIDSLGEKRVPTTAYYGIQTLRAVENFPVSGIKTHSALVRAYMQLKKAAVLANIEVGRLYPTIGHAIVTACDDVLSGKYADQFIVDAFQAGAGTSFNMNCNEVLANRALELLGKQKGDYASVGPNDHVNMAQSSNDTFPTALHIALLSSLAELLPILKEFANAFFKKAEEFKAYASAITRATQQLHEQSKQLNALALGGTAVGTGANTHPDYQHFAIKNLCEITGLDLTAASDLHEALQSRLAIASVSGALKALALEIIRIANDLRLLSSGPTTGLAEIELPPVQPGSSIMPGKINPSMAECLNMIAFQIVGNDVTISMAVQAGQLDLNVMTPVMAHNALQSIDLLKNYLPIFIEKCIYGIKVNRERCEAYLVHNPSLATFLSPHIGYLEAGKLAKEALEKNMSIKDLVLAKNLLTEEEAERIFNAEFLVGAKK